MRKVGKPRTRKGIMGKLGNTGKGRKAGEG